MSSNSSSDQVIFLDGKVSPTILASIFGMNQSLVYQEAQKGRLPTTLTESTYRECIKMYLAHFKKAQDLRIEKAKLDDQFARDKLDKQLEIQSRRKASFSGGESSGEESIHPLMAAKMKQDIRLGRAKEEQLLQKNAIEREEYIALERMLELVEPVVIQLRGSLLAIADIDAEHEKLVDQVMQDIYTLALRLCEDAVSDSKEFVATMMEREITFDD